LLTFDASTEKIQLIDINCAHYPYNIYFGNTYSTNPRTTLKLINTFDFLDNQHL